MTTTDLVRHARIMRNDLAGELPNGVGNTIDYMADRLEQLQSLVCEARDVIRKTGGGDALLNDIDSYLAA
jgi:hypothetical protein